jgi:hypothetical protein
MGLGTAWPFYCGSNPKCISGQQDEAKRRIEEATRCATTGRSTRAEAQMGMYWAQPAAYGHLESHAARTALSRV